MRVAIIVRLLPKERAAIKRVAARELLSVTAWARQLLVKAAKAG